MLKACAPIFRFYRLVKPNSFKQSLKRKSLIALRVNLKTSAIANTSSGPPSRDPKQTIESIINSPDNPVLNRNYNISDNRAKELKQAVITSAAAIVDLPTRTVNKNSPNNPKRVLDTFNSKTYKGQAGIYAIRNVMTGQVAVGQSLDVQRRTEQYLNRGNKASSNGFAVSRAFTEAVHALKGIPVRAAFECIMLLHWPKSQSKPGFYAGVTQVSQNEMNFCESLFIHVFQQLGLSYNTILAPPTNTSCLPKPITPMAPNPNALQPSRQMGRACRVNGINYLSQKDYETYKKQVENKVVNRQRLRNKLNQNPTDPNHPKYDPENRWLTEEEIKIAIANNDIAQYDRKISIK